MSGTGALHRLLATPRTPGHLGQHVEDARDVGGVASEVVAIDSQVSHRDPRHPLVMPPVHDEHPVPTFVQPLHDASADERRATQHEDPHGPQYGSDPGPATNRRTVP